MIKYSVIIPTLNESKLIKKNLEQFSSAELKKKFNYEVIVSDGGSNDGTVELALQFADKVKILAEPHKKNIARGRNDGADVADGEVLIFTNADVFFENVEKTFNYLEDHFINSNHPAMTCTVYVFPEEEKLIDKLFHKVNNNYFYYLNKFFMGAGRGEFLVVRKSVFEKVNGFNEVLAAGEDFDLFRRIRGIGKIHFARKIKVFESPRRYRKYGYGKVALSWFTNSVSIVTKKKSLSEIWDEVR